MVGWCGQVLVNALGELVGGTVIAVVFGVVVTYVLGLRHWAKEQEADKQERVGRTLTYLGLVRDEVERIEKWIPGQVKRVKSKTWGMAIPIATPVWDVVQQSGELVPLVNPKVLERTAYFYEEIGIAAHILDFLMRSWLVPEEGVPDLDKKQAEAVKAVAGALEMAGRSAKKLLAVLEGEIGVLKDRLEELG